MQTVLNNFEFIITQQYTYNFILFYNYTIKPHLHCLLLFSLNTGSKGMHKFTNQHTKTRLRKILGQNRKHCMKAKTPKSSARKYLLNEKQQPHNVQYSNIVNLSDLKLNSLQEKVLNKGLNFVVTPKNVNTHTT